MNPVASFWIAHLAFCEAQWHDSAPDSDEGMIGKRHLVARSPSEAVRLRAMNERIKRDVATRLTPEDDALARIEASNRWWAPVQSSQPVAKKTMRGRSR